MISFLGQKTLYHEQGTFDVKASVAGIQARDLETIELSGLDSSGQILKTSYRIWGSKIVCSFDIDDRVSDGTALISVSVVTKENVRHSKNLYFLVVK